MQRHFDTLRYDEPEGWEVVDAGKPLDEVGGGGWLASVQVPGRADAGRFAARKGGTSPEKAGAEKAGVSWPDKPGWVGDACGSWPHSEPSLRPVAAAGPVRRNC